VGATVSLARCLGAAWRLRREEIAFDSEHPDIAAAIRSPAGQPGRAWCELLGFAWSPECRHVFDEQHSDELFCRCGARQATSLPTPDPTQRAM
jgi:hypothetical protein